MSGRLANDVAKGLNLLSVNASEEAARDIFQLMAKYPGVLAAAAAASARFRVTKAQLGNYPAAKYPGVVLILSDYANLEVISDGTAWRALRAHRIAGSNTSVSSTNTTNEEVIAEVVIPGGIMGETGGLRVSVWPESEGANTGTRDVFIRYGGAVLGEGRVSTAAQAASGGMSWYEIHNVNANSQTGQWPTSRSLDIVQAPAAPKSANVNSAVDQVLQIRTKKSVGTDDFKIKRWQVEVLPPL